MELDISLPFASDEIQRVNASISKTLCNPEGRGLYNETGFSLFKYFSTGIRTNLIKLIAQEKIMIGTAFMQLHTSSPF